MFKVNFDLLGGMDKWLEQFGETSTNMKRHVEVLKCRGGSNELQLLRLL